MTSRLTLAALVFSVLSTAVMVGSLETSTTPAATTRVVQLERVTISAPRLQAQA